MRDTPPAGKDSPGLFSCPGLASYQKDEMTERARHFLSERDVRRLKLRRACGRIKAFHPHVGEVDRDGGLSAACGRLQMAGRLPAVRVQSLGSGRVGPSSQMTLPRENGAMVAHVKRDPSS